MGKQTINTNAHRRGHRRPTPCALQLLCVATYRTLAALRTAVLSTRVRSCEYSVARRHACRVRKVHATRVRSAKGHRACVRAPRCVLSTRVYSRIPACSAALYATIRASPREAAMRGHVLCPGRATYCSFYLCPGGPHSCCVCAS